MCRALIQLTAARQVAVSALLQSETEKQAAAERLALQAGEAGRAAYSTLQTITDDEVVRSEAWQALLEADLRVEQGAHALLPGSHGRRVAADELRRADAELHRARSALRGC